jgi:hypothetical protein
MRSAACLFKHGRSCNFGVERKSIDRIGIKRFGDPVNNQLNMPDETWRCFSTLGSEARELEGLSVTKQTGGECPPYWFSGESTIILGRSPKSNEVQECETRAGWIVTMDAASVQHFQRGFIILGCLRFFGGLHSLKFNTRADIFFNDQRIDGFALRIIPREHSDYFLRIPVPTLPEIGTISGCQTLYVWPLQRDDLALNGMQKINVRIDPEVRWDIDYVAIVVLARRLTPRVFLSHNWEDKSTARLLASRLYGRGIGVWLDEAEIKLGDSLIQKIRAGLDEVDYVVALLSQKSLGSTWVAKELDVAMNQEIENRRVKVLPVRLDDSDMPGFLKGKLYADLRSPDKLDSVVAMIEARLRA